MGKAHKALVEEAKKRSALQTVKDYVSKNKNALEQGVRNHMATEILIATRKLVLQDIKHGKTKDVEAYVKKSLESINGKAFNMVTNSGVTLAEIEAVIRQTIIEGK
jgi:hypothetical protein